jgi:hypothetical protein
LLTARLASPNQAAVAEAMIPDSEVVAQPGGYRQVAGQMGHPYPEHGNQDSRQHKKQHG